MSSPHANLDSALRHLAELRIEQAMREGKFDNLPGAGQPVEIEPMPVDEGARMLWWALRLMRRQERGPTEQRCGEQIESLRRHLESAVQETQVRTLVGGINALIRQTNALRLQRKAALLPELDLDQELLRFARRTSPAAAAVRPCRNPLCQSRNPSSATFCRRCGERQ